MKTIQKTPLSLLLIVFLTAAACNTPTALGEMTSPTQPEPATAAENSTALLAGEASCNETGEASTAPLASGTLVFTAEPLEPTDPPSEAQEPPAQQDTQAVSANESLPPEEDDGGEAAPEAGAESDRDTATAENPMPGFALDAGCGVKGVKGNKAFEEILLNLINQERASQGLNQLVLEPRLITAARVHSLDMACENYFNHTGSDGSSPFQRIGTSGYPYEAAGENIYAGSGPYNCAQEAFKAWMKSATHQEVMLNKHFEEIGIGYAFNPESTYGGYFTAVFASR